MLRWLIRLARDRKVITARQYEYGCTLMAECGRMICEWLKDARQRDWVVYCKKPVAGAAQIVEYLSRYSHRTAIADRRILDIGDRTVTFSWKDYRLADARGPAPKREMTVDGIEFIRRFMQHILPDSFKGNRQHAA